MHLMTGFISYGIAAVFKILSLSHNPACKFWLSLIKLCTTNAPNWIFIDIKTRANLLAAGYLKSAVLLSWSHLIAIGKYIWNVILPAAFVWMIVVITERKHSVSPGLHCGSDAAKTVNIIIYLKLKKKSAQHFKSKILNTISINR